jgi:perosamine synthetase
MNQLAIHGGEPAVSIPEPHIRWPNISNKAIESIQEACTNGLNRVSVQKNIQKLEEELASFFGKKHALSFNSGTAGLLCAYRGLGINEGDEVIVQGNTFFSSVTPLYHIGADVKAVDCNEIGQIDLDALFSIVSPITKAIVATHMWGYSCDMERLSAFCKTKDILLVEDIAHSPGAKYSGTLLGTLGDASIGSFHGEKTLSGGEGGFMVTDTDEVYYNALLHSNFNRRTRTQIPETNELSDYRLTGYGMKSKLHPLAAIIVRDQLEKLPEIIISRHMNAERMMERIKNIPHIACFEVQDQLEPSWHSLMVRYGGNTPIDSIIKAINAEGATRIDKPGATKPLSFLPFFQDPDRLFKTKKISRFTPGDFPKAEYLYANIIQLPVFAFDIKLTDQYLDGLEKVFMNLH